MKKIICFLLMLSAVVSFSACAVTPGRNTTDSTTAAFSDGTNGPSAETTVSPDEADDLGNVKFPNGHYTILSRKSTSYEVLTDDDASDSVSDAVNRRNAKIEDRFGVKINVVEIPGDWGQRDSFISTVDTAFTGGTHDYDFVMTHSAYVVNIALRGYAFDMNKLQNINFEKRWWCKKYIDNASVDGTAYVAMGDLGHSLYEYMECVFFNKSLTDKLQINDLYETVEAGEWTFEKMREYALMLSDDSDGNGVYDDNDIYGLGINNHALRMTVSFWDLGVTVKDADGRQVLNLPNDKYIKAYEMLYDLVWSNTKYVNYHSEGGDQVKLFANDQLMFFVERLLDAGKMRDMTSDYGIVPFPKYSTEQAEYISSARDALTAYLVMRDIENEELVGTVTEALCMEGYRMVVPTYYEKTLKYRYLSDPVAMKMLDLIRNTMSFDFSTTYTNSLKLIFSTIGDNIQNKAKSISPLLKANKKGWEQMINQIYTDYEKIK